MNIAGIIHESLNDGEGIRTVIFISGCKHNCYNCQNKRLFNFHYGKSFNKSMQDYLINYIKTDPLIDGITLSGGDPVYSAKELIPFLQRVKKECPEKDIWMYTGFSYEKIKNEEILKYIDIMVDGRFVESLKDMNLKFRGSSNQRIIDVQKSLQQNKVILYKEKELN